MRLKHIKLVRENELKPRIVDFASQFNYIYNPKNNMGKSTFLRMLLYALGFPIPNTKKVRFENFEIELQVEVNNNNIFITRKNKNLWVNNVEFVLPKDFQMAHLSIFGDKKNNHNLINNLLGVIYIDQDRGWTLLNRGNVIGSANFSIEEFLQGLKNFDDDLVAKVKLQEIKSEIKKYKQMKTIGKYQENIMKTNGDYNINKGEIAFDTHTDELQAILNDLKFQKSKVLKRIKKLEETISENIRFVDWLEQHNIFVKSSNNESIPVNRDTIENYNDNTELAKIEKRREEIILRKLTMEIAKINEEINKQPTLFKTDTLSDLFDKRISKIHINLNAVEKTIKELSQKRKELQTTIRRNTREKNEHTERLFNLIKGYAKELDVGDFLLNIENVFTSDLKSISGAIYHKLVFIFRISYLKLLCELLEYKLPFFIDSPNGREVEQRAIEDMIKILERDFSEHQIFIASIYNTFIKDEYPHKRIDINGKFFDKNDINLLNFHEHKLSEFEDKKD